MISLSRLGIVIVGSLCLGSAFAQTPTASPPAPAAQPAAPPPKPHETPLSADDVSWLFPTPTKSEDLANLISMADLAAPDPKDPTKHDRVWSDEAFQ